jgi:hypothetical protein
MRFGSSWAQPQLTERLGSEFLRSQEAIPIDAVITYHLMRRALLEMVAALMAYGYPVSRAKLEDPRGHAGQPVRHRHAASRRWRSRR